MTVRKEFLVIVFILTGIFSASYFEVPPIRQMMDWKATRNATAENKVSFSDYQFYDRSNGEEPELTVDFLKGKHFWNPQVVIWLEDSAGNYLETLLVTTSTARGLFYSGRSAENFKQSDEVKTEENNPTRRVDALPYWSHKRGHKYPDGFYSPPPDQPLPDAITGATPKENFHVKSDPPSLEKLTAFRVLVEVNVAFDENEYYSEYDFPEDSLYHSGTGLLGQPSVIYSATISKSDQNRYYVLSLLGHGHHSGSTGELFADMKTLSTARYIVERIVVGVNERWYNEQ
jgi:hypothetical protein